MSMACTPKLVNKKKLCQQHLILSPTFYRPLSDSDELVIKIRIIKSQSVH